MGEGSSEIRHLRERVLLHDDMLRAMGERIRLLDEAVHALEAAFGEAGGPPPGAALSVAAPSRSSPGRKK